MIDAQEPAVSVEGSNPSRSERRRPGRIETATPALIPLLRDCADDKPAKGVLATVSRRFAPGSRIEPEAWLARPQALNPHGAADPCSTCEARTISVCNTIPDADLARLAAITVETEAPAGQGFIDEGEPATCFFIVTVGTAKLFKLLPDGRQQITGFVGPGQFLGLAVSDIYAFSAEAIDRVRYCRIPRDKLRALLDDFPLMERRLLEDASNELVAAQEQMLLLGRKTARERLASFLLMQSRQGMPSGHSRQRFRLPMTRIDVADYLGLTIETISRTLTRLRAEGLIDIESQNGFVICDPAALEGLAGGFR